MVYFSEYSMFLLLGKVFYKCQLDPGGLCYSSVLFIFFPGNSVNYFKKGVAVSIKTVDLFILLKSLYLLNWFITYLNNKQYGGSSELLYDLAIPLLSIYLEKCKH